MLCRGCVVPAVFLAACLCVTCVLSGTVAGADEHHHHHHLHHSSSPSQTKWKQSFDSRVAKFVAGRDVCLGCPVALEFEAHTVIDFVGYHTAMGVDCFVLLLDMSRFNPADHAAQQALSSLRKLAADGLVLMAEFKKKEDPPSSVDARPLFYGLPSRLAAMPDFASGKVHLPRFFAYIDADELLVLSGPDRADGAGNPVPPALLEFLERQFAAEDGAVAMYLKRYSFGTSGYIELPANVTEGGLPAFAVLVDRRKGGDVAEEYSRMCARRYPGCEDHGLRAQPPYKFRAGHTAEWHWNGKIIQRLRGQGRPLKCGNMHRYTLNQGQSVLMPNGTAMPPPNSPVYNKVKPLWVTHQPLSINHYMTGPLHACYRKAKRTGFHGHHRSLEECDVFHSGGEGSNFQDDAVAKYALAIQAWKQSKLSGAK